MGLDIIAFEKATLVEHTPDEGTWCTEHEVAFAYPEFAGHALEGLKPLGCYGLSGGNHSFKAGSYTGYNDWRRRLSTLVNAYTPQWLWEHADNHREDPFFELINFADNEGVLGPVASNHLLDDFVNHRQQLHAMTEDEFMHSYDNWMRAFKLAAKGGMVVFG